MAEEKSFAKATWQIMEQLLEVRNGRIASVKKNMHPLHAKELVW